jgi:hypothetical protein
VLEAWFQCDVRGGRTFKRWGLVIRSLGTLPTDGTSTGLKNELVLTRPSF